jgi:hypothetical protein
MEVARIHGDQQIGRTVTAFATEALQQLLGLAGEQIDPNPGLLGEAVEQWFDQFFLAGRVEVDLTLGSGGGRAGQRQGQGGGQGKHERIEQSGSRHD